MSKSILGVSYNPPYISGSNSTTTGATSETMLNHIYIPANTFQQYDSFIVNTRIRKNTTGATASLRLRIHTSASVGGNMVGFYNSTLSTHTLIPFERRFTIQTLSTDTEVFTSTTTLSSDFGGAPTTAISSFSIDWSVDQYIIVTGQSTSATEALNCPFIYTELLQPK
jgi:hypothetical protein